VPALKSRVRREGSLDVGEAVEVLDLALDTERRVAGLSDRDVCVHPKTPLLHAAVAHLCVRQDLLEGRQVNPRLRWRADVGLAHDLGERSACPVQIHRGFSGNPVVQQLAGVFLYVETGNPTAHPAPLR